MWFELRGDERLGRCTSDGCGGQPTSRLEAGGIGSNFCSGCRAAIERLQSRQKEDLSEQRRIVSSVMIPPAHDDRLDRANQ